jgi:hypothetical protein
MNGVRLDGRAFIACKTAPTDSRSSFAGDATGIDGFDSVSAAPARADVLGRRSGAVASAGGGFEPVLRTGAAIAGFAGVSGGDCAAFSPGASEAASSSVKFKALSIADIAAETGSGAEYCFAMTSASFRRR